MKHVLGLALSITTAVTLAVAEPTVSESPIDFRQWSDQQKEQLLRTAKIVKKKRLKVGITGSSRATLSDGVFEHDAHIQTIDERKFRFEKADGGVEINFRDSYKFNVAAYKLDRMLKLNMVPVSVERTIGSGDASVTWWVDEVKMMDIERYTKKIAVPDPDRWNDQMHNVRVFNEVLYNTDANLGNVLITNDWQIRLIDFTRAFRRMKSLRAPKNLGRVDRRIYDALKALNEGQLMAAMGSLLQKGEVRAIVARRDRIVDFFDKEVAKKGEEAVICGRRGH